MTRRPYAPTPRFSARRIARALRLHALLGLDGLTGGVRCYTHRASNHVSELAARVRAFDADVTVTSDSSTSLVDVLREVFDLDIYGLRDLVAEARRPGP